MKRWRALGFLVINLIDSRNTQKFNFLLNFFELSPSAIATHVALCATFEIYLTFNILKKSIT
jgi:hypothetical protein